MISAKDARLIVDQVAADKLKESERIAKEMESFVDEGIRSASEKGYWSFTLEQGNAKALEIIAKKLKNIGYAVEDEYHGQITISW